MSTKELVERTSDTPRTDAKHRWLILNADGPQEVILQLAHFARQLERELLAKGGQQDLTVDDRLALQRIRDEGYAKGDGAQGVEFTQSDLNAEYVRGRSDGFDAGLLKASYVCERNVDRWERLAGTYKSDSDETAAFCRGNESRKLAADIRALIPPVERDDSKGEKT